ncbi:MAG: adenylate/guanylate cyclase domain-containing protein [Gammaproteobacteria bacterium]
MEFDRLLSEVHLELQRDRRIAYRVLKRRYSLTDDDLEDLKADLIDAKRVARDEDGKVLVWNGDDDTPAPPPRVPLAPSTYTPDHLAARIRAQQQALEARGSDGERKTITVLFADLKGSTALLEGLDPEAARAVIDPALKIMMDAVHRFEGYVAQALGDGILALFGAPLAHEDHAHRAVYAALRMQEDLRRHADAVRLSHGASLAMRVGLNTGEVVVRSIRRDDLHTDYVPVGHSINLAARMEQMAPPGAVLVTEHTQRLVEGYFALKPLGQAEIRGVTGALEIFEVTGVSQLRTRLQVAARRGLSPFVGRQHELTQLRAALERARGGHGQVVCVMGEAGLGKSRLLLEFKTYTDGFAVYEAYSASHGKASPYLPIAELLKGFFGIQLQDDERARREKVIGRILALDRGLADVLPYYFALLNIDEPDSPLARMDPPTRRRRTFEALRKVVLRASLEQPLVLVYEDLHWVDSETQGFLDLLVESLGSARILLLTNYRPEYRHDWGGKSYCTQLRLQPFGRADAEAFVSMLLGEGADAAALATIRGRILDRAEGTPFFIEELVQEFFERGVLVCDADGRVAYRAGADVQGQLPTTVQGVLAARIDRLSVDEKALLQTLAVIGREFTLGLAHRVVGGQEDRLHALLAELQRKEFLYEQPAFPEVQYLFKHALTQEVAYQSLLVERRRELHQRIAEVIEALYVRELEDHYASLAHHFGRSGDVEKALEYLERAGLQAARQAAMGEAVTHLSQARAAARPAGRNGQGRTGPAPRARADPGGAHEPRHGDPRAGGAVAGDAEVMRTRGPRGRIADRADRAPHQRAGAR